MSKFKVGDPVIFYKPIWMNSIWIKGIVDEIKYTKVYPKQDDSTIFYKIKILKDGRWIDGFNIFPKSEHIKIDKETLRDWKLNELGI